MSRADIALGNERLLQLAEILDTSDERHASRGSPGYDQSKYIHPCGTPACALGEWACSNPDRWAMFDSQGQPCMSFRANPDLALHEAAMQEFALDRIGEISLFGLSGCGHAKTAKNAAAYIRAFVARRQS